MVLWRLAVRDYDFGGDSPNLAKPGRSDISFITLIHAFSENNETVYLVEKWSVRIS